MATTNIENGRNGRNASIEYALEQARDAVRAYDGLQERILELERRDHALLPTEAQPEYLQLEADRDRVQRELTSTMLERDDAYLQRNRLVALLTSMYPSMLQKTDIEGWDPAWSWCVFVNAPCGQLSWHIHESELELFTAVPRADPDAKPMWDGHTTEQKYERVEQLRCGLRMRREGPFEAPWNLHKR